VFGLKIGGNVESRVDPVVNAAGGEMAVGCVLRGRRRLPETVLAMQVFYDSISAKARALCLRREEIR
jgi:hypothetical protein